MDKHNLVGVVTVTYNSAGVIDDFMNSILQQLHYDFALYIVDNASSDDTLRLVAKYQDSRVVIVRNSDNVGVAEGNNIGIRAAMKDGCDAVLLINNDTVFDSGLVSKLQDSLRDYGCEMVVPKISLCDEPEKIWCAGGYLSNWRATGRHFGYNVQDKGQFDKPRAVSYSPTCCMLIKKDVFARVGLMDATYFAYFDDTDFCLRANRAGVRLHYVPSVRLLHKVSALTGDQSEFSARHLTRNHVYYILKNYARWLSPLYLLAFQAQILTRCLLSRSLKTSAMTEKAFFEGISLFLSRSKRMRSGFSLTEAQ